MSKAIKNVTFLENGRVEIDEFDFFILKSVYQQAPEPVQQVVSNSNVSTQQGKRKVAKRERHQDVIDTVGTHTITNAADLADKMKISKDYAHTLLQDMLYAKTIRKINGAYAKLLDAVPENLYINISVSDRKKKIEKAKLSDPHLSGFLEIGKATNIFPSLVKDAVQKM